MMRPWSFLFYYVLTLAFLLVVTLLPTSQSHSQSARDAAVLDSQEFVETFDVFYGDLSDLETDILLLELSDKIETALISGSNLAPVTLDYRIRAVEQFLFRGLKRKVCPEIQHEQLSMKALQRATVRSITEAAEQQELLLTEADYGMIAGILVRILERASGRFCQSTAFDQLGT